RHRRKAWIATQMLEVRYRPRDRLAQEGNRGHVGGQKIQQSATEMTLEQIVSFQIRQLQEQQLAPITGRHDSIKRILIAEKESQRHAGRLRQVHKKQARAEWRPDGMSVHRLQTGGSRRFARSRRVFTDTKLEHTMIRQPNVGFAGSQAVDGSESQGLQILGLAN